MATRDTCCSIVPYFRVNDGKIDDFRALCERFVEKTGEEADCLFYGFSFHGDEVHCREGYENADGLLTHLGNVAPLIEEALAISDLYRLEVHGPEDELTKLRGPLAELDPTYFTLEYGFRH